MIFLVKALVGVTAVAVPVSIGTVVTYRESIFGNSQSEVSVEYLKEKCYVIPTEEKENQAKLLVCGKGSYFLYNNQGNNKTDIPEQIKKKGDNLEILWEAWGNNSGSTSSQNVNLKISNSRDWTNVKEGTNIKNSCQLVADSGGGRQSRMTV